MHAVLVVRKRSQRPPDAGMSRAGAGRGDEDVIDLPPAAFELCTTLRDACECDDAAAAAAAGILVGAGDEIRVPIPAGAISRGVLEAIGALCEAHAQGGPAFDTAMHMVAKKKKIAKSDVDGRGELRALLAAADYLNCSVVRKSICGIFCCPIWREVRRGVSVVPFPADLVTRLNINRSPVDIDVAPLLEYLRRLCNLIPTGVKKEDLHRIPATCNSAAAYNIAFNLTDGASPEMRNNRQLLYNFVGELFEAAAIWLFRFGREVPVAMRRLELPNSCDQEILDQAGAPLPPRKASLVQAAGYAAAVLEWARPRHEAFSKLLGRTFSNIERSRLQGMKPFSELVAPALLRAWLREELPPLADAAAASLLGCARGLPDPEGVRALTELYGLVDYAGDVDILKLWEPASVEIGARIQNSLLDAVSRALRPGADPCPAPQALAEAAKQYAPPAWARYRYRWDPEGVLSFGYPFKKLAEERAAAGI
eukprot:tig00000248_g21803.t1